MRARTTRLRAGGLLVALLAVACLAGSGPATAAPNEYARSIGTATGTETTVATNVPVLVRTSAPCPAGTGSVNGFFESTDAGIPAGSLVISANSTDVATLATTGMPLDNNLKGLAQTAGTVLVNGRYDVQIVCYPDAFSQPTAQFDGVFTVTGGVGAGPGTTATWTVAGSTATTTTLALSPTVSVQAGAALTLTATVAPAAAAGTVQFGRVVAGQGTLPVGSPVSLTGGTATLSTTTLPVGDAALVATFVPASSAFLTSTSPAQSITVLALGQSATTTTLTTAPAGAAAQGTPVTLTASVTPATAAGDVTFLADGAAIGTAPVSAGTASLTTSTLDPGTRSLAARFAPADTAALAGSTSAAVSLTVSAATSGGALLGDLDVVGASGSVTDSLGIVLESQQACPGGDALLGSLKGPGAWAAGLEVPVEGDLSAAGGTVSLKRLDQVAPISVGKYFVFLTCQVSLTKQSFGFFVARLWFYDATHWLSQDPMVVGIPTVTSVVVKPAARQDIGLPVVLEATVDQAAAAGKVTFSYEKDGTITEVTKDVVKGTAQATVPELPLGLYYVTATFEPADTNVPPYNTSTSAETFFAMAPGLPPLVTAAARVTGTPTVGRVLTCAAAFTGDRADTPAGKAPSTTVTYRWERNRSVVAGARGRTWTVTAADAGKALRCRATATNGNGTVYRVSAAVRVAR